MIKTLIPALIIVSCLLLPLAGQAKAPLTREDKFVGQYARSIANYCVGYDWGNDKCVTTYANSYKVMASNYIALLQQHGKTAAAEKAKKLCAASTVVAGKNLSKDIISETFVKCINGIVDVTGMSGGIRPNINHYQLNMIAVYCLRGNPQCAAVEKQLEKYKD